jgi:hypothetical protein
MDAEKYVYPGKDDCKKTQRCFNFPVVFNCKTRYIKLRSNFSKEINVLRVAHKAAKAKS